MRQSSSAEDACLCDAAGILKIRHAIHKEIRSFFDRLDFVEVETPIRVPCPCIDPYIDALSAEQGYYLATSPELQMKRLLGSGLEKIYQITHAFRAEEEGHMHSAEFTMLEWYRTGTDYLGIMEETEALLRALYATDAVPSVEWEFPLQRLSVSDLYTDHAGWDPCSNWDEDRYFRDWVDGIEPALQNMPAVFVMDFPAPLASLSRLKTDNPKVCERFELFMSGIEIGNAFSELLDYDEHVKRFATVHEKRRAMKKVCYPDDKKFLAAIAQGLPRCGGIAVGVDRLIMALLHIDHIDNVQSFPLSRL